MTEVSKSSMEFVPYGCALLCAFEGRKGRERKGDRHSCIILREMNGRDMYRCKSGINRIASQRRSTCSKGYCWNETCLSDAVSHVRTRQTSFSVLLTALSMCVMTSVVRRRSFPPINSNSFLVGRRIQYETRARARNAVVTSHGPTTLIALTRHSVAIDPPCELPPPLDQAQPGKMKRVPL